ncbi:hypothetical protein R6Q59_006121 [Mikania micrantha]
MDSMQQQLRRENQTDEPEIQIPMEKDEVPKTTSHIESLTVKDQPEIIGPSLEEISKYRSTAQQNSIEAIRAAGEQYRRTINELTGQQQAENTAARASGTVVEVREKEAKDVAPEIGKTSGGYVGKMAKDKAVGATETGGDTVVGTKDVSVGVGKKTKDMVGDDEDREEHEGGYS